MPESLSLAASAALPFLLYFSLKKAAGMPLLVVLPDLRMEEQLRTSLQNLRGATGGDFFILSIPECSRGEILSPGGESARSRALHQALSGNFDLVTGSIHAFTAPAPAPEVSRRAELVLHPGLEIPITELAEKLTALDYDDEYETVVSGEFSRRGGVIDLFSPAHDFPCRIEFFGDEIESMRSYDPATQRSTGKIDSYEVIGRSGITAGGEHKSDLFAYFAGKPFRMLCIYPENIEDHLLRFGDAAHVRLKRFQEICAGLRTENRLWEWHEMEQPGCPLSPILPVDLETGNEEFSGGESKLRSMELRRRMLQSYLTALAAENNTLYFAVAKRARIRAWRNTLEREFPGLAFEILLLPLSGGGIRLIEEKTVIISEKLFSGAGFSSSSAAAVEFDGEEPDVKTAPPLLHPDSIPEFSLADLEEGDYAVHVDHGICIYRGIRSLESSGSTREVLTLEFQDEQLMYVPVIQAYKINRYLGAAGKVKLHAIGKARWNKEKAVARAGVRSYAAEMLRFQALRLSRPGIVYPPDNEEDVAFRRAFPFTDTPDQTRATAEIMKDMQSDRPMDRLLCGDVGYGKTEIAMRAAEKAVSAGYQVAILAPTTLLAQQHYLSFTERFAPYPYTIGLLSRFRSASEQAETLRLLQSGAIDIVIGTHRLCNPEIRFSNLGLVIIDEEQRFGVRHKERLRRFRVEADVLSMSATPIPRTLYLAMAGGRDLSTLMTPPKLRLPVKTFIAPEDDDLIVSVMQAEFARGGQVYFLHNRVKTIETRAEELRQLMPGSRIQVAHGQMPEEQLENVMNEFLTGKIDCLLCSTIVESGLDVPNANTIIIERADRFGLAELYQLRGRVGRWKHQAYAYMLLPKNQLISTDARKRLAAIRRCSSLGAGFQLALRDLEIRGSGNLLGQEQSGHLNLIGFDLYCQLLKIELAAMKGEKLEILPDVDVGIDFVSFGLPAAKGMLAAAIPPEYVNAERLRLDAYRQLGRFTRTEELDGFLAEMRDRYGKTPQPVINLAEITRLRILAARANFESLSVADGKVILRKCGSPAVYRVNGRVPQIDYRNSPEMRLLLLRKILENELENQIRKAEKF